MKRIRSLKVMRGMVIASVVLAVALIASVTLLLKPGEAAVPTLSNADVNAIVAAAILQADAEPSGLRAGTGTKTRMHIAVVDRDGKLRALHSMSDAWVGSVDIAIAKAYTATAFSSDENALTSGHIGILSQPGEPLWQIGNSNRPKTNNGEIQERGIIEFPGGIPLYNADGKLVGAIGVSGDGVGQDEDVAVAGSCGFEAPGIIQTVLPYLTAGTFTCLP